MALKDRIERLEACIEKQVEQIKLAQLEAEKSKATEREMKARAEEAESENRDLIRKLSRAMGYIDALNEGKQTQPSAITTPFYDTPSIGPKLHDQI